MATSIMTPASVSTEYLLADLRASRSWQRHAIAEATEAPVEEVARWDDDDLDHLEPYHRRQVEAILSTASTVPWWSREH